MFKIQGRTLTSKRPLFVYTLFIFPLLQRQVISTIFKDYYFELKSTRQSIIYKDTQRILKYPVLLKLQSKITKITTHNT